MHKFFFFFFFFLGGGGLPTNRPTGMPTCSKQYAPSFFRRGHNYTYFSKPLQHLDIEGLLYLYSAKRLRAICNEVR